MQIDHRGRPRPGQWPDDIPYRGQTAVASVWDQAPDEYPEHSVNVPNQQAQDSPSSKPKKRIATDVHVGYEGEVIAELEQPSKRRRPDPSVTANPYLDSSDRHSSEASPCTLPVAAKSKTGERVQGPTKTDPDALRSAVSRYGAPSRMKTR